MSSNQENNVLNQQNAPDTSSSNGQEQQHTEISIEPQELPQQSSVRDTRTPLVSKEISDVFEFCEPSTSNNYAFKTQIQISIIGEPKTSNRTIHSTDTDISLFQRPKQIQEDAESYTTVDTCIKDKQTNTTEPTLFSQNQRTQQVLQVTAVDRRYEAPPPYDYSSAPQPPPYSGQRQPPPPVYYTVGPPPRNARRGEAYQRNGGGGGNFFSDDFYSDTFLERQIRHNFIQKVYTILGVQLIFTTAFVAFAMFYKPVNQFVKTNLPCFIVSMVLFFILYIALACYQALRRISPLNFILLALFTICLSYMTAVITVFYETKIVMITFGATAAVCLLVSILACQMSCDITKCGPILAIAGLILIIYGVIIMILGIFMQVKILFLVYSCIATVLFVLYLMYDTQLIMGGRSISMSAEEYILGALTLYVDIIYIFINLLAIIGYR